MGVNDEINSPTASEFDFTYDINSSPHDKFTGSKERYRLLNAAKPSYYDEKTRLELIEWDRKERERKEYERTHPKKGIKLKNSESRVSTSTLRREYNPFAYGKYYNPICIVYNREEYENDNDPRKDHQPQKQANMQKARVFHYALAEEEANEQKVRVFRSALTEEEAEAYYQEWKASLDEIEPPPIYQLRFYWQDSEF